jgi:hypothetical protein
MSCYYYLLLKLPGRQRRLHNGPLAPEPSGNAPNTSEVKIGVFSDNPPRALLIYVYLHLTHAAGRICSMHLGVLIKRLNYNGLLNFGWQPVFV